MFNRRPAFPRNTVTWEAYIVFNFLKWSPAANLSLPQLTLRVVLLCLLLSGQMDQALWLLDLCNITWSKTDIRCTFESISKISAPNRHQDELVFGSFPEDKSLCVVHYLRHHKKRTCALRGSETKLFISWKAPHSGVSRDTLRRNGLRWVWRLLALICQSSLPIRRGHRPVKQSRNCRWLLSWRLWVGGARVHSLLYTRSQYAKEMPFRMLYSPTTEVCAYWWFVYRVCKLVQMLQSLQSHVISHSSRNCGR